MDDDQRHRALAAGLPMAMAQDLNVMFHVEHSLFGRRQFVAAGEEIADESLRVAAQKGPSRAERLAEEVGGACGFRTGMPNRCSIGRDVLAPVAPEVGIAVVHL
jgi:hypothetical protein